jgi:inosine-uridine nucleoside N-ribohydrolase
MNITCAGRYCCVLIGATLILLNAMRAAAQSPAIEKIPILVDTDAGSDVDDAFALGLILASPELELRGITTSGSDPQTRALLLCRFLTMTGRRHTQVAAGSDPQPVRTIRGQYQYYYHPDVIFHRTTRPVKESAVDFLCSRLKAQPGKITIVAIGPLTNIARLIAEKPECKPWIKRIITASGTSDGAQAVLDSGIDIVVLAPPLANRLKLGDKDLARVFAPGTALSLQVQALHQLSDEAPRLGDALAVTLCLDKRFCKLGSYHAAVIGGKLVWDSDKKPNATVATEVDRDVFLKWYVERMGSCVAPAQKPAKLVARGGFPHRVHVAEDYDNDIERKWWMAGKAETKNLPSGSLRACRGVLTHDFDDLLGNPKAMWTAVIFNPVPGPPMGKNTRLTFRYWLKGTDTLRVQIYSLTNGYHRNLVLNGLPEGRWDSATVDMTVARRPDGTGGSLSEGERIDDIQFYAEPTAELIVDDIVLYDAAPPGEKRPFPKRIFFTGLFDSGKQGKEWPGAFEIVPQKGFFWHGAKSVTNADSGMPWIRLGLRGERTLGDATHLNFRYRLTGADTMRLGLVNRTAKATQFMEVKGLTQEKWAEATFSFSGTNPGTPKSAHRVDEVQFLLPAGAELIIDDVLLFEPGR